MKPTQKEFTEWQTARRGNANPKNMTNPYWVWGVENPLSAYEMADEFEEDLDENYFDEEKEPRWCFERFGQTETALNDGSIVYIAGEHEDYYDPDFFIYNDVVVVSPQGKITIYGYSEELFPATDFHTATLVNDEIILIGSLGYPDYRDASQTQVLVLNTNDWSIRKQVTAQSPGWISNHDATYDPQKNVIRVTNIQKWTEEKDLADDFSSWELDLALWQWSCTEVRNWSQYRFSRKDGEMNQLWEIRNNHVTEGLEIDIFAELNDEDFDAETKAMMKEMNEEMKNETAETMRRAKPELLVTLYHPTVPFTEIPRPEVDYDAENVEEQEELIDKTYPFNHYRIEINGVHVCFIEEKSEVTMRVEGELDESTIKKLLKNISKNLSKVEGVKYTASKL